MKLTPTSSTCTYQQTPNRAPLLCISNYPLIWVTVWSALYLSGQYFLWSWLEAVRERIVATTSVKWLDLDTLRMASSAPSSPRSWRHDITVYLIFVVLTTTLGPLQFGYHLVTLHTINAGP